MGGVASVIRDKCTSKPTGASTPLLFRPSTEHPPTTPDHLAAVVAKRLLALSPSEYSGPCCVNVEEIQQLCLVSRRLHLQEKPLVHTSVPAFVIGDLHGQFGDLLSILARCGYPTAQPQTSYVFLGDYVDRGRNSLETLLLLLCLKILHPAQVHLLRGNHECAPVNVVYGFYEECKKRLVSEHGCSGIRVWRSIVSVFNCLPIACIVGDRIFCVHGGLSPDILFVEEINKLPKQTEIPEAGLLTDLLWSDPAQPEEESRLVRGWGPNERGVSFVFGAEVVSAFLARNGLDLVCRGHMVVEDGYEFYAGMSLVTVFSAPRYCGEFDNLGAVLVIGEKLNCCFELFQ